jgi:ATP-binding cassette, subfamily B, bacterial
VWQSSRIWNSAKLILVILQGIIPVVLLYLMKLLVDDVIALIALGESTVFDGQILLLLLSVIILNIINSSLSILQNLVNETQQQYFTDYIQTLLHDKFSQIDYAHYESPEHQDIFHKAQKDGLIRPNLIIQALSTIIQNLITVIGIALILFTLNLYILPLLLIAMIPTSYIHTKFSKRKNDWELQKINLHRKSFYFNHILTDIVYAKEIRIFNFFSGFQKSFKEIRKDLLSGKLKINKLQTRSLVMANIIELVVLGGMYFYTISKSLIGAISIGSLVMYFQAFQRGQTALKATLKGVTELFEHRLFLVQLFEFLELKSGVPKIKNPVTFPNEVKDSLKLSKLSFKYENSENSILDDISTEFKINQITAIVGENGSGKSTLSNLICRIYEPTNGSIQIDNTAYSEMTIEEVRKNTSSVFQDYSRFYLPAKQNITGSTENFSDKNLKRALHYSSADKIIERLPHGIDNWLGRHYETNGKELSGGEWQRIAISRAFYKDCPVIILDEPTTFVDGIMEQQFLKSLDEIKLNKIVILISHKVSNIKIADKVIVIKEGKIIDEGTHLHLYKTNAYYKYLLNLKAWQ